MARMRDRLDAPVLVGVGAAFDFHAGLVPQAPAAMQRLGLEWAVPAGAGAAPAVAALPALQPALRARLRAPVRARTACRAPLACTRSWPTTSPSSGWAGSGCRSRSCFADAGLRVLGVDKDAERLDALRAGRMPFKEPGTDELLARVGRLDALRARRRRRRRPTSIVLTLGTPTLLAHRDRHGRHPRRCSTTCCRCCARATCWCCARRSRPARRSSSPATWRSTAASRVGEDVFVAHVPGADRRRPLPGGDRDAAVHRRRRRRRRPASAPPSCSRAFGAPIVQTTPVQAELAKIWANILRYATFALPNLLMMDCERYGANVFEVIDLINRDYPRGGIALPGLHRRDLPAQGLRVLARSAPARRACCSPSRASTRACRCSWSTASSAGSADAARAQGRRARAGVQARHRRRARLAVAQADPAARARAGRRRGPRPGRRRRPTPDFDEAIAGADVVVVATNHCAYSRPETLAAIAERAAPDCLVVDPWNAFGAGQVFAYASEVAALRHLSGDDTDRVASAYAGYEAQPRASAAPGTRATRATRRSATSSRRRCWRRSSARRASLLDAGCGPGWWLTRLRARGRAGRAAARLDAARPRAASAAAAAPPGGGRRGPGRRRRTGDVRALPYEDGRFAAVVPVHRPLLDGLGRRTSVSGRRRRGAAGAGPRRRAGRCGSRALPNPRQPDTRAWSGRATSARACESSTLTLLPWLARGSASRTATLLPPPGRASRCCAPIGSTSARPLASPRAHEPCPRHRRRRHDRRGGRPPPAARPRLRGPRLRPARRPRLDARGLRGPPRRPAGAGRGAQGDERLLARHPPGGDRGRDRQLPQAPPHAHRGQQRALQRRLPRRAGRRRDPLRLRQLLDGVRARASSTRRREDYIDDCPVPLSAYGFSKLTGEIYCRAAHDEHGLPYTICRPFNAYGPGEMPDAEPGIAHAVPDLIRKSLAGMRPLPIFGSRRADAHADPRRPTSPTGSSPRWRPPPGSTRTSTSPPPTS